MNRQRHESIAKIEDEKLAVFVRSPDRVLQSAELDLVAGGERSRWVPDG